MHDPLGDAMKALERASAPDAFPAENPIYARIDGRGFSRFTRGMMRPFDPRMTDAMKRTTLNLLSATGAKAAYVQSDEISLVWDGNSETGEHFFGGKPFKMCSVLAGLATACFTNALIECGNGLAAFLSRLPHFDARVVSLPDRATAAEMVAWRGQDAARNAISMLAQSRYSHKSLQGVSTREMRERLKADGVSTADFPPSAMHGALILNRTRMIPLNETVRMQIPAAKRPSADHLFKRTVPVVFDQRHPGQITNLVDVIFEGDDPATAQDILSLEHAE